MDKFKNILESTGGLPASAPDSTGLDRLKDVLITLICTSSIQPSSTGLTLTPAPCQKGRYNVNDDVLYYPYDDRLQKNYNELAVPAKIMGLPGQSYKQKNGKVSKILDGHYNIKIKSSLGVVTSFIVHCSFLRPINNDPITQVFNPNQQLWLWLPNKNKYIPVIFGSKNGADKATVYNTKKQKLPEVEYKYLRENNNVITKYNQFLLEFSQPTPGDTIINPSGSQTSSSIENRSVLDTKARVDLNLNKMDQKDIDIKQNKTPRPDNVVSKDLEKKLKDITKQKNDIEVEIQNMENQQKLDIVKQLTQQLTNTQQNMQLLTQQLNQVKGSSTY